MLSRWRHVPLACAVALALAAAPRFARAQGGAAPFMPEAQRINPEAASGSPSPAPGANSSPRLRQFVEAVYPDEGRAAGLQGSVVLQISIDETGHVTDATVVDGLGHGFDEAAVAAARRFEFDPARQAGTPVAARIRYRYRFTLAASAAPSAAPGPAAIIAGEVRDAVNHPVAGAVITLHADDGEEQHATTEAAGAFRFEVAHTGIVTVSVSAPGFRDFRAEEQVGHEALQLVYRLSPVPPPVASSQPSGAPEQEVTVRATRPPREVTRTTLDRREVLRIPGTGGDALRSIQNLPGMSRPSFLSGALIVRGSAPADTQVFVDGTELPLLYHFGGLSSVIQTEMLDRIDFYPGNFSSRFGRAMGGVVDVGLRSPRHENYHAVVNINGIDASIFVEGPVIPHHPELTLALAARRSYVDVILGAVLRNQNVGFTAAPVYWDYQGVLEWRPNSHHRLRLAVLGDDDTLSILFRDPNDAAPTFAGQFAFAERFHLAQLSWVFDPAPGTRSVAMVSVGYTGIGFSGGSLFNLTINSYPVNARYELQHTISQYARMNLGIDLITGPADVNVQFGQANAPIGFKLFQFRAGAYAEAEITPLHGLRIVPGVRVDWFGDISAAIVQPRMNFRWDLAHGFAVKGGVGLYAQPPSLQESTNAPNPAFPSRLLGNPFLMPQRAMHYALGVEQAFPSVHGAEWLSHLTLSVEGFYKVLDSLVVSTPNLAIRQESTVYPYQSIGSGHVLGLEVLLRFRPDAHFFGWVAYTLMRATRSDGPGLPEHLYTYDQTHILTVLGSYRLPAGFEVGLRFRYVTGSLFTPIVSSYYNADSMQYVGISGATNSERLADFNQLDLRVDKTFRFRWGSIGLYLEILNLYNAGNQEGWQYNYNYTRRAPINGLPFFPNLGIRGEL